VPKRTARAAARTAASQTAPQSDSKSRRRLNELRREIQQIVFPNADEAAAARNRIASGLSFEDLAKERGLGQSDIDLGLIAKSAIGDSAIADAAFSLPYGEVSQPAQGRFGVALVKVDKIEPGVTASYLQLTAFDLQQDARGQWPHCARALGRYPEIDIAAHQRVPHGHGGAEKHPGPS